VLDQLVASHGAPKQITVYNGSEFAGRVLDVRAYAQGVTLDFIEPGKPTQNAHSESFNGKVRDERLDLHRICIGSAWDLHWFGSLAHARGVIHAWKEEYNTERPHNALRWRTPAAFAQSIAI
jgi:putative transposase